MSSHNDSFVASGSSPIFLFRLNTRQAVEWVAENVRSDAQFFGDALVVEHRYARLAPGFVADGLEVS